MSLRASQTARPAACPESRLDLALRVGQHRLGKRVSHAQIGELAGLLHRLKTEDIDGTGKRKVDGSLAATRLGQSTTERWCNERKPLGLKPETARSPGATLCALCDPRVSGLIPHGQALGSACC